MNEVIAMHGWGGDSNTWNAWEYHFKQQGWNWQSADRGYGKGIINCPKWKSKSNSYSKHNRALICHSLGIHLAEEEILKHATHIVFLCSFGRFIPKGPNNRALIASLNGMQQLIGTSNEQEMLDAFLGKACAPLDASAAPKGPLSKGLSQQGRKILQKDLQLLRITDGLPKGIPQDSNVLVIQANEDKIIHEETKANLINDLENKLNKSPLHWQIPNAGHILLVPELIIKVRKWLEA